MFDVKKIREDFPILSRMAYGKPLVYLDNGATAQKPLRVIEKIDTLHRELNANVHRGVHFLSAGSTIEYESARDTVCGFINASDRSEVIFTSGATASLNMVAFSFGEKFVGNGDNVIVSEMEHHSNIVPWQMLCERKGAQLRVLPFDDSGRLQEEELADLIDERTRIVSVTQASNVLGTSPDLERIISIAHSHDIPVMVDGCQGIVHGGADVQQLDCDFYAFSGHKLYGPTGIGVLYGKRKWLEQIPPFMGGGDMVQSVSFGKTVYEELPQKFEAGTANFIGAIGMAEGIRYMQDLDIAGVNAHEKRLLDYCTERLLALGGITIYGTQPGKCPIVSFNAEGIHPSDIGMILDTHGVAVRAGAHCAEPIMEHYGISAMCRASFALYNTIEEVDILVDGVKDALKILGRG